jgi:hypothetical protein
MTKARQKQRKKARAAGLTKNKIPVFWPPRPPTEEELAEEERRRREPWTQADEEDFAGWLRERGLKN